MLKKYLPFFVIQIFSNAVWVFWVLPAIGEEGSFTQTAQWLAMQILLPTLLGMLLAWRRRYVLWLLILYASSILLSAFGVFGWALMGPGTPLPVYGVCFLFFIIGFGVLFRSMKDLGIGQKPRNYGLDE